MYKAPNDYTLITSKGDQRSKRIELLQQTGKAGANFERFISASIVWFYGESDHNINVINDLLVIAENSHGYNVQRLASYLKRIIPHAYIEATNKRKAHFDTKPKGKKYPTNDKVLRFLALNPEWNKTGASKTAADYDETKHVASVIAKIAKNNGNVLDFANALIKAHADKIAA